MVFTLIKNEIKMFARIIAKIINITIFNKFSKNFKSKNVFIFRYKFFNKQFSIWISKFYINSDALINYIDYLNINYKLFISTISID